MKGKKLLDVIEGKAQASSTALCLGCGMALGLNLINVKIKFIPCKKCGEDTTWRKMK